MIPQDRIRDLCVQALAAENDDEALDRIIPQIQEAVDELIGITEYRIHKNAALN